MTIPERVRFLVDTLSNIETLVELAKRQLEYLQGDVHRAEEKGPSVFDPDADPTSESGGDTGDDA